MDISTKILSDIVVYMKYAKYLPEKQRRETWEELIDRNKEMHIKKFPDLKREIEEAYKFVYDKKVLPSMRALQFSGKPIEINNARQFNCSYLPIDNLEAFNEIMWLLLAGVGVGYSVQKHHIRKLPEVRKPTKKKRRFLINDSQEGWSDAIKVLLKAYMGDRIAPPDFDYSDIRPEGAPLKTSGGRAPGPKPLKKCIDLITGILDNKEDGSKLTPLEVHDIICHMADCILAGGIRRSACIALFSFDDNEMMECKFGNWWELNPQRARANNSVVMVRHKCKKEDFDTIFEKVKLSGSGEPAVFFSNDKSIGANPCVEISLKPQQFCNLTEINAGDVESQEDFEARCLAATFIGTLQASYTNFHYLREEWKETTEDEALLGVSMTGIASGNVLKLDLTKAAKVCIEENKRVSKLIGIKQAARITTVKPAGSTSLVFGTSSGIHNWYAPYYIRRIRILKNSALYTYLYINHPELIEDDYFKPTTEAVISIPIKAPEEALYTSEPALDMLERVKQVYENWIKPGHRKGSNTHNVSVTINVRKGEWDKVKEWMWENKNSYAAISLFPYDDHSYVQAPFEEITEEKYEEMIKSLKQIDLSKVIEMEDTTDLKGEAACAGGACEIK